VIIHLRIEGDKCCVEIFRGATEVIVYFKDKQLVFEWYEELEKAVNLLAQSTMNEGKQPRIHRSVSAMQVPTNKGEIPSITIIPVVDPTGRDDEVNVQRKTTIVRSSSASLTTSSQEKKSRIARKKKSRTKTELNESLSLEDQSLQLSNIDSDSGKKEPKKIKRAKNIRRSLKIRKSDETTNDPPSSPKRRSDEQI